MLVVGLTGSIAMGKSTAAAHLRSRGVPVFDADAIVHEIYREEAVPLIEAAFPGTTDTEGVNRSKLSDVLQRDPAGFKRLEASCIRWFGRGSKDFSKKRKLPLSRSRYWMCRCSMKQASIRRSMRSSL